jgi:hypothetical protein
LTQRWRFRRSAANAKLDGIADDIKTNTTSSLLYSLAFLYETPGVVLDAIKAVTADKNIFVYGISDKKVGGLDVQDPSGNVAAVFAAELSANVPEPFKSEPSGVAGARMHHKFTVIDWRAWRANNGHWLTVAKCQGQMCLMTVHNSNTAMPPPK